jgi:hypothetical protein
MLLNRYKNLHLIQQLDPVEDHCRIYHLMNGYEIANVGPPENVKQQSSD